MAYGASNSNSVSYPFPDENVSPKVKEDPMKWGLPLAKAIWYNRAFNNPHLFYNVRKDYYERINFALGLNNVDEFKPMLGVNPTEAQATFLPNIDWSIKNYATKRVNIATAKITNRFYDPVFTASDNYALDREKDYRFKLKAYMENQAYLEEMNQKVASIATTPEEVDPEIMPHNDVELDLHMKMNYKDKGAVWLEKRVKYFMDRNRYTDIKSKGAFDEFVLGVRIEHVDMDAFGRPRIRWINPAKFIGPYIDNSYPTNMQYGADIEFYEISDARKLWEGEFDGEREDYIIRNWATTENLYYDSYGGYGHNATSTKKIKILRFEYRSLDERVYVESRDPYDNQRFVERDFNFYRNENQRAKFEEKNAGRAKLIRNGVDTVYTGYWIVDSDIIFGYKRKEWQEGEWGALGQGRIGYKLAAPNLRDGKVISTVDQMIPVLRELQRYHLKVQHIVGASVPKGIGIDLEALRRADLKGPNGKAMSDLQKIKFYQQTGIFVFNPGDGSIYGKGATQKPIYEVENGVAQDLVHYVELTNMALGQLDEIIGINEVTAASPVHERKGARVAQMQQAATETALWYLYEADEHIFKEVAKSLAIRAVQGELFNPDYYREAFGQSSIDFIREYRMDKTEYGMVLEVQPTNEEWQIFYGEVAEARAQGTVTMSQSLLLKRLPTLKEAEAMFRLFEERNKREAAESQAMAVQQNTEAQSMVAEQSHGFSMELEGAKTQGEKEKLNGQAILEQLKQQGEMKRLYLEAMLNGNLKDREIRTQGDEDAQLTVLEGQIKKDIEKMKLEKQPKQVAAKK